MHATHTKSVIEKIGNDKNVLYYIIIIIIIIHCLPSYYFLNLIELTRMH